MTKHRLLPPLFPAAWACEFAEDCYGLKMSFSYKNVSHTLRWMPPATFMMGSADDEKGRLDREDLHQVTLTQGFWLAETTVTQALWQAVMDNNPSRFINANRPVERVSWDDAQAFIDKLNHFFHPLQTEYIFCLPSEAQWEYACRANTQTPFNFEEDINLKHVNYNGTWDSYFDNVKGVLQQTAIVKTYPCNEWGLYEMHGNVWEWCQDNWQSRLGKKAVINPVHVSKENSSARVVRGGSWNGLGQCARSAYRGRYSAGNRFNFQGFRLSLGLQAKSSSLK